MELYSIRRMSIKDAQAVAQLEAASFTRPWTLADFQYEMLKNPVARYVVAERDGQLLGFAGAHIIFEEGHVTNVVVSTAARRQGIGRALMEALIQYAANLGVAYLTLEVRAGNETAISLYRSLGFHKVAVRAKYYEDNQEDAWLMVCDSLPTAQADFSEEGTASG
jgi:ribosomal-protein-alanine N-acetyltransferase